LFGYFGIKTVGPTISPTFLHRLSQFPG